MTTTTIESNDWLNESYLNKLNEFLTTSTNNNNNNTTINPTSTLISLTEASSPELESNGSSPSASSTSGQYNNINNNNATLINSIPLTSNSINMNQLNQIDKRKQEDDKLNQGPSKDSRRDSSNGDSDSGGNGIHSHPDFDDEENKQNQDEEGNINKLGGKTSDKRKQQNRAAQRAFRERKELHLKELEDRVFSLERAGNEKENENGALKELLERLQEENQRLKVFESAFEFTYTKDVSDSTTMPLAPQFISPPINSNLTSSSSITNLFPTTTASTSTAIVPDYTTLSNSFTLSPPTSFGLSPSPPSTSNLYNNSLQSSSTKDEFFYNPSSTSSSSLLGGLNSISSPNSNSTTSPNSNLILTPPPTILLDSTMNSLSFPSPGGTSDLFSNYRDSLINTSISTGTGYEKEEDFLNLFGNLPSLSSSTTNINSFLSNPTSSSSNNNNNLDLDLDLTSYLNSPSPTPKPHPTQQQAQLSPTESESLLAMGVLPPNQHGMMNPMCPIYQASLISGGFDPSTITGGGSGMGENGGIKLEEKKFEFDVDGLCSDMKAKATCQEAARLALHQAMEEDARSTERLFAGRTLSGSSGSSTSN